MRALHGFQEKLAAHEAKALLATGSSLVVLALDGWDAQGLKAIATAATAASPDAVIALFTTTTPSQVVIARGSNARVDAGALLKQLASQFGGKGGGKPDLAQGGGFDASSAELIGFVRGALDVPASPAG